MEHRATGAARKRFSAVLKMKGINAYVDVPKSVSSFFGERGNVPVHARLGRRSFRATLVPIGGGRHILYVNQPMLEAAGADPGGHVGVEVRLDARSRMPPMHPGLARALRKNRHAKAAWSGLTDSRKKEILRYLHAMKTPEGLARNVRKVVVMLGGGKARPPAGM